MAINITKLLAAINTKVTAADSSQSIIELNRLASAATLGNDVKHARIFTALTDLPTADSTNVGDIVRVGATLDSDTTKYYLSHNDKWKLITLQDSSTISQGGGGGYSFQGSNFGYASGGSVPSGPINVIEKFSFTSDGNATDVADLTIARSAEAGQSSTVSGYTSGGTEPPATGLSNVIDKFPFAADGNATDVGDLTVTRNLAGGQSSSDNGYSAGGRTPGYVNTIDKFSFASDGNATDVGDTVSTLYGPSGQNSPSTGYVSGGTFPPTDPEGVYTNVIQKFPFASDANATNVADLTVSRRQAAGQSSSASGYTSGGINPGDANAQTTIDKFPFASDTNATDVGDHLVATYGSAGQSSTASGYISGGVSLKNDIQKFSFSSDGNATDVGNLTVGKQNLVGQQY
jgi:hypothetical protein